MPITTTDAPKTLPEDAKKAYVGAFNGAYDGTCAKSGSRRDECASRVAWSAVKKGWKQNAKGDWVERSHAPSSEPPLPSTPGSPPPPVPVKLSLPASLEDVETMMSSGEAAQLRSSQVFMDFIITKASSSDKRMRWSARASDTLADDYNTRMTRTLFENFIARARGHSLPYLGIAHYDALGGAGVAGVTDEIWVDGDIFKAKGTFNNNSLGRALFGAVTQERNDPSMEPERKVRISIAFLDLHHSHGPFEFVRKSLTDVCPVCEGGHHPDTFLDGILVHFAATRVPVNTRTSLEVGLEERSSPIVTRHDDAASIVGDELARELERLTMEEVSVTQSHVSDQALVVKSESAATEAPEAPKAPEDPIVAARARLQQRTAPQVPTPQASSVVEESAVQTESLAPDGVWMPYGGSTTLREALEFDNARKAEYAFLNAVDMAMSVVSNVLSSSSVPTPDKLKAVESVFTELSECWDDEVSKLELHSQGEAEMPNDESTKGESTGTSSTQEESKVVRSEAPVLSIENRVAEEVDPVAVAVAEFGRAVAAALADQALDSKSKLAALQPKLEAMSKVIVDAANKPVVLDPTVMAIRSTMEQQLKPVADAVNALVAVLGRQMDTAAPAARTRRTFSHVAQPAVGSQSPSPLSQTVRRSVGLKD